MPTRDHSRRDLAVVLVSAIMVRVFFLIWSWSGSPFFAHQSTLSQTYFKEGYAIAAGYGYVLGESPKGNAVLGDLYRRVTFNREIASPEHATILSSEDVRPELLHPPGMAILVAAVHRIFKTAADVPIQLLAIVLDVISAWIFWWILRRSFSAPIALIGGILYAVFLPFAYYTVAKEPDGMLGVFVVVALACAIKGATTDHWRALSWNTAAGVSIGIGSYLRPDYLLVAIVMFFGMWVYTRRFWRSLGAAVVMQGVALLILLPWAYRNYGVCQRLVFTSTSVGATLITGLGEFQNPWGFGAFDEDRETQAKAQGISSAWHCEGDLYLRRLFFKSVLERPDAYLATIVKRVPIVLATPFTFGFQNPWKTQTFSQAREAGDDRYQVLLRRPGYLFAAYWDYIAMSSLTLFCFIAILFMAIKERSQAGLIFLLTSPHLYSIGTHMLTHMEPRFLLPSMFCWLIGPAYVLSRYSNYRRCDRV